MEALFNRCFPMFTVCSPLGHFLWGQQVGNRDKTGLSALRPCRTGSVVAPNQTTFSSLCCAFFHTLGCFTVQSAEAMWVCSPSPEPGRKHTVECFFLSHNSSISQAISIFCCFGHTLLSGPLTLPVRRPVSQRYLKALWCCRYSGFLTRLLR